MLKHHQSKRILGCEKGAITSIRHYFDASISFGNNWPLWSLSNFSSNYCKFRRFLWLFECVCAFISSHDIHLNYKPLLHTNQQHQLGFDRRDKNRCTFCSPCFVRNWSNVVVFNLLIAVYFLLLLEQLVFERAWFALIEWVSYSMRERRRRRRRKQMKNRKLWKR